MGLRNLVLAWAREFGAERSLNLRDDLAVGNGLSILVLVYDCRLFVNCLSKLSLSHFFSRTSLLNGLAQTEADLLVCGDGIAAK